MLAEKLQRSNSRPEECEGVECSRKGEQSTVVYRRLSRVIVSGETIFIVLYFYICMYLVSLKD